MDSRFTPPKRVTSPTWGPPPPCRQALKVILDFLGKGGGGAKAARNFPFIQISTRITQILTRWCSIPSNMFSLLSIYVFFSDFPAILHNLFVAKNVVVELPNVCLATANQVLH